MFFIIHPHSPSLVNLKILRRLYQDGLKNRVKEYCKNDKKVTILFLEKDTLLNNSFQLHYHQKIIIT